jgi:exodeoxyribonuclease V alpha subunit
MQVASHSSREKIHGSVERVTFHSAESGYCVIRVKAKGHSDLVTLVGHLASVSPGEYVEALGTWAQHRDFGLQFKAEAVKTVHPSTIEGIEKYLGSGMIKGIGPHFAKKLVKAFGLNVFDTIENSPETLASVPGIGPVRIKKIKTAWKEQRVVRDIMVFLQSHGVSTAKAVRIYKTYGESAVSRVTANPYQLARDIHGIGFKSADVIAGHLGIEKNSVVRARAGVNHVLMERVSEGHCAYPKEELIQESSVLLEIDLVILQQAVDLEVGEGHLVPEEIEGRNCLYAAGIFKHEKDVAESLATLAHGKPAWGEIHSQKAIEWVEKKLTMELAPLQKEAVAQALRSKVLIITGGPGTGKTTLTRAILEILKVKNVSMSLCSPTGRAAKRLSECTGMEAKTIHRLLRFDPKKGGFLHNREKPFDSDLVLIDEASMVDVSLMHHLLKAVPPRAALIVVGDVDQLPSVGPGSVLSSLIESGGLPCVRLNQIFRQAAKSAIILNAHRINQGATPELRPQAKESDFHFVQSEEPENTVLKIIDLVKNRIPRHLKIDAIRDIQVLCPMNRGALGARALNLELQNALNPDPKVKVEKYGTTFAPGDKVMVTVNDYDKEVFNGDIGFIKQLDLGEHEALVDFEGREVVFDFSDLDILTLAYATTVHKAQGSEYPAVVMPVAMQHFMMLKRNLLYTGVTRGKRLVVMVGQKKAVAIAIKAKNQGKRWNNLAPRLANLLANGHTGNAASK